MERYETGEFESGGYKWKLVIYPNGNKNNNVDKHMSLYLAIEAEDLRPPGWEVHAIFRFFLHDQIRDNYLTIEDIHSLHTHNGYLVDDTCVFGAEVFVSKQRSMDKVECLALIKDSITKKSVIRFDYYSELTGESHYSAPFNVGNHKWKIRICPIGEGIGMGIYNSLYLALADPKSLLPGMKIFADFTLRILDQVYGWKHQYAKRNCQLLLADGLVPQAMSMVGTDSSQSVLPI
uniref:MATH domain-containing protein n=1 Tax=Quercus lobata TaxID=97700 RepID=A0A7N2KUL1_QUELO